MLHSLLAVGHGIEPTYKVHRGESSFTSKLIETEGWTTCSRHNPVRCVAPKTERMQPAERARHLDEPFGVERQVPPASYERALGGYEIRLLYDGNGGSGQEGMLVRGLVERQDFLRSVFLR